MIPATVAVVGSREQNCAIPEQAHLPLDEADEDEVGVRLVISSIITPRHDPGR